MADFVIGQSDTPIFARTLEDSTGAAVNINGATVKLTVTTIHGGTAIVSNTTITNLDDGTPANRGKVSYTFTAGQTATAGDYLARFIVTYVGGAVQSFPNDGYILITITQTAPTAAGRYLTLDEFKSTKTLLNKTYADEDIRIAISAASRGLEAAYDLEWTLGSAGEVRYYQRVNDREVILGDAINITAVGLDYGVGDYGPGTYSQALSSTDYRILPIKSGLAANGGNGEPYHRLRLSRAASVLFLPDGLDAIRVTGTFGWETIPSGVKNATAIITSRLLQRGREAPFGIVSLGLDGASMRATQIARDPDIAYALEGVTPTRVSFA